MLSPRTIRRAGRASTVAGVPLPPAPLPPVPLPPAPLPPVPGPASGVPVAGVPPVPPTTAVPPVPPVLGRVVPPVPPVLLPYGLASSLPQAPAATAAPSSASKI